jgi:hypothetical protein
MKSKYFSNDFGNKSRIFRLWTVITQNPCLHWFPGLPAMVGVIYWLKIRISLFNSAFFWNSLIMP